MAKAFELTGVHKNFGTIMALNGVTLSAEQGTIYGLLGPNGAGKTTIVKILSTLLALDSGSAKVAGIDVDKHPNEVRRLIGMAGQYAALDEFQTGYENIFMNARLYGLSVKESRQRTTELLGKLDLVKAGNRQVKTYSGGMRRRLDLGASLVGKPKVMFLDEPTTGLDPKTRMDIWEIVKDLVAEGTSILLTTQYLEEADRLANHIAVIDKGKVIADGTSRQLKALLGGDIIEFVIKNKSQVSEAMAVSKQYAEKEVIFVPETSTFRVPVCSGGACLMGIVQALNDKKIAVVSLALHQPSLDDVFLSLTGKNIKTTAKKGKK
jgi:ABC-2 type transport system ATP-binding protein